MHPADRQALLKKKGITQQSIADEVGVSAMSVSKEINGIATSEKIRVAVAERLGLDKVQVFPEYYLGKKRRQRRAAG